LSQNHDNGELPARLAALQMLSGAARVDTPLRAPQTAHRDVQYRI